MKPQEARQNNIKPQEARQNNNIPQEARQNNNIPHDARKMEQSQVEERNWSQEEMDQGFDEIQEIMDQGNNGNPNQNQNRNQERNRNQNGNQEQNQDRYNLERIIRIQTGQPLRRMNSGKYVGMEKHPIEVDHPERIPRQLEFSPYGRWALVPQSRNFRGKWPRCNAVIRIEPYRQNEENDEREEIREAMAYGRSALNNPCWYDYEEWRQYFSEYEEPERSECTWMNGEIFTNKIVIGRFGPPHGPRQNADQGGDRNLEEEYRPPRRSRGNRGGYGRGQARRYEEEEYQSQDNRPRRYRGQDREEGYRVTARAEADNDDYREQDYEPHRGRGSRSRGRGGRRGTRGHRGD